MSKHTSRLAAILAFAACILVAPALADDLGPGDPLPALALADQHDEPGSIDENTRLILFTDDMDASDFVEEALAENGAAKLEAAGAVWVADISAMPGIITRLFALPALRERPYPMLLDRDGEATESLPNVEEHVTLLYLDGGSIERVEFAGSTEQVTAALQPAAEKASE